MSRHPLHLILFFLGLAVTCWIAVGYLGTNVLALAVTLLIAAGYMSGGLELHRYRRATASLTNALSGLSGPPPVLADWLGTLDASLRNPVRLRIEGERTALPAPALAPALVGLLVLLGMLGTLLGMMATLRGTGMALETATDLQAIRDSLAAPVKGLGFAFGTSIAGIATSAMLGLLAALCRRERLAVVQQLDAHIATDLREHSQSHRREQTLRLMQRQVELMPGLIEHLQAMMASLEQQAQAASERQSASQDAFHARTEAIHVQLAASVERSLRDSLADSARATGQALQPVVQETMAAVAREAASLHEGVGRALHTQLDVMTSGFEANTGAVTALWTQAVAEQTQSNATLAGELREALERFNDSFEQRSSALLENVSTRLDASAGHVAAAWKDALAQQGDSNDALAARQREALESAAATFEQHAAKLLEAVDASHAELQGTLAGQDEARLAVWNDSLAAMGTALREDWQRIGEHAAQKQQDICDALGRTAQEITEQTRSHAGQTIAEISRLVQTASEAPKAAAEVVAELRQKLSDSMVRDTAMLEERSRLLATLETLLDAVTDASTRQRTAIDALVEGSAGVLDRVGTRFTEHIGNETGRLDEAANRIAVGSVEIASLGDAFGAAVQSFGESSTQLSERLARIEEALDKSLQRSDEQLAYYVAQAREVIDLSMLTQKQIVEDLQRIATQRDGAAAA